MELAGLYKFSGGRWGGVGRVYKFAKGRRVGWAIGGVGFLGVYKFAWGRRGGNSDGINLQGVGGWVW